MIRSLVKGRAGYLILNDVAGENRFSVELIKKIEKALKNFGNNKNIDAIVIKSSLEYFSRGLPVKDAMTFNETSAKIYSKAGQYLVSTIRNIKKPVIALVNKEVLSGAFEMVLACDMVFASEDTCFGFPEVNLGIIPGFGGLQLLGRRVHETLAKYLLFTGETVLAHDLNRYGLLFRVYKDVSEAELNIEHFIVKLQNKSIFAIGLGKETINNGLETSFEKALLIEQNAFTVAFSSNDKFEGMTAFIEKREPVFNDRWEDYEDLK